jgi:hypothetical protein
MSNPEAVPVLNTKHMRPLERRRNYLLAKLARGDYPGLSWDNAERLALDAVLAHLREQGFDDRY